jgi:hypothetical protein
MSVSVLIEPVEAEGFGWGGVVAAAFGDVQVGGVFNSRDDDGAEPPAGISTPYRSHRRTLNAHAPLVR